MTRRFASTRNLLHLLQRSVGGIDRKDRYGIGYCNVTNCCTRVCPAEIKITENAIIPQKERVVDAFYDPLIRFWRFFGRRFSRSR